MIQSMIRIVLASLAFITIQAYAFEVDKIVLFGDSLSDNGNLFAISSSAHKVMPLVPVVPKEPYYKGRFSNGPVWDEVLTENINIDLANYAYGGAWVEPTWDSGQVVPFDLNTQVNFYLVSASKDSGKEKHLYVLWAGANDYTPGRKDIEAATTKTIDIIQKQIEWLVYYGAKHFMLATIPDLGRVPEVVAKGPDFAAGVTKSVELHNAKLYKMIDNMKVKYPDVTFVVMDMREPFSDLMDHPEKYNIKNVREGCYTGDYMLSERMMNPAEIKAANDAVKIDLRNNDSLRTAYLTAKMYEQGTQSCEHPDEYFYWDHIHPTRIIHHIIALSAQEFLAQSGITPAPKKIS